MTDCRLDWQEVARQMERAGWLAVSPEGRRCESCAHFDPRPPMRCRARAIPTHGRAGCQGHELRPLPQVGGAA